MKFLECLSESMKSGTKFRNKTWSDNQYLFVKEDKIHHSRGGLTQEKDLCRVGYDDWELCTDPKISELKNGERLEYHGYVYTKVTVYSLNRNIVLGHGILRVDYSVELLPDNTNVRRYTR